MWKPTIGSPCESTESGGHRAEQPGLLARYQPEAHLQLSEIQARQVAADETQSVVVRFKHHLEGLRYSARVIVHQVWAVRRFVTYLEQLGLTVEVVRPADVETFLRCPIGAVSQAAIGGLPGSRRSGGRSSCAPICSLLRMVDPQWPPATPPSSAHEQLQRKICDGYAQVAH